MNISFLSKTLLFRGASETEIEAMLHCLGAHSKLFGKGETVFRAGQTTDCLGLVLSGSIIIENNDVWGNRNILGHASAGQIFGETYSCIPGEPMLVNVIADTRSEILFLDTGRLIQTCPNSCSHHRIMIENLLQICARKNLELSRRSLHTSSKSIRGRLLSYFSDQAMQNGSMEFTIPYNRQQLADYLGVDRSAMSNELSKMRREKLIDYKKNSFHLHQ